MSVLVASGMRLDLDNLPSDTALLHQLVRDMVAVVEHREDEIERLLGVIKKLQRMQFGRRSERLDPDQLALHLQAPPQRLFAPLRELRRGRRHSEPATPDLHPGPG